MSQRGAIPAQWPLLAALLVGVITIVSIWFAISQPISSDKPTQTGGRYIEGVVGQPSRINPLFASLNDPDRDIVSLVFSGLTRLGPSGEPLPSLARSWDISDDGRTYTFQLQPNVFWHDGQRFSAADVVFTYSLLANPDFPSDPILGELWQQVECSEPDPLTVLCQLPAPYAPFLSFATIGILPSHDLQGVSARSLADHPFNRDPIGTGLFRLTRLDERSALLERNPTYHLGPAQLDEIEFRFYPDEHAAMTALHRDDIQGLLLSTNVASDDLDALTAREDLQVYSSNRTGYTILYLNNEGSILEDARVRRAIAHTVNRDRIIAGLLCSRAVRADSPIPPGTWAYDPDLDPIPYDPDKARQLLDDAGWTRSENGTRTQDSQRLRISLLADSDPLRTAVAQVVADQLSEVGIEVEVLTHGASDLVQDFLIPRDYQAAIFGWDPGYDPDPYPAWHSSGTNEGGRNLAGYVSMTADELMEEARTTVDFSQPPAPLPSLPTHLQPGSAQPPSLLPHLQLLHSRLRRGRGGWHTLRHQPALR